MKWSIAVVAGLLSAGIAVAKDRPDPAALAAEIDRIVAVKLKASNVPPAPLSDDAEFYRRVHLSLRGAPSFDTSIIFDKDDPGKRAKAIDSLFDYGFFADHFAHTMSEWLLPEAAANPEIASLSFGFEKWLRERIEKGVPYDRLVSELLTAPLTGQPTMARLPRTPDGKEEPEDPPNPLAFYIAKDGKPENLAAATSRIFLGVQLECAQCHNHPFAKWSREQFWGLAAFYAGVERQGGTLRESRDRRELVIPNADRVAAPTFLDDKEPEWQFKKSPRFTLAAWLTSRDNPFFARAAVNRFWGFLFGVGIVDPVDDFHEQNPPSHPELLDALTKAFVDSGYDVKFIIRAIVLSDTYQRTSAITHPGQKDVRLFACFPVQGLTAEQLARTLSELRVDGSLWNRDTFARTGKATEAPTTIIQALALMNGRAVGKVTADSSHGALAAALKKSPAEGVKSLYLDVLGRPPRPEELKVALAHIEAAPDGDAPPRYADILWALVNGVEFRTNH